MPGEDWNCGSCLACFTAMVANMSVCGPYFFFPSMHNLHFWLISFPHLTSWESRKCTGTPYSIPLPPVIHRPFIENHSIVQTTKFSKTAVQHFKCRCLHAAEARLEFLKTFIGRLQNTSNASKALFKLFRQSISLRQYWWDYIAKNPSSYILRNKKINGKSIPKMHSSIYSHTDNRGTWGLQCHWKKRWEVDRILQTK